MNMIEDLRFACRMMLKAPGFTLVLVFTLALTIGANSAIFSVVSGVLIKPLPYHEPERLVGIWHTASGLGIKELNSAPSTYFTYKEENRVFENTGLWQGGSAAVNGIGEPEQVRVLRFTEGTLPTLRTQPMLGRLFDANDTRPNAPDTVILCYGFWQKKFGGNASVLGQNITVDSKPRLIIGVMRRDFRFLDREAALLIPLQLDRAKVFVGQFSYQSIARLKPGVTLATANADVGRMLPMMMTRFPMPPGLSLKVISDARIEPNVKPLKDEVVGDIGAVLWVLMGTAGLVLLIACANLANLLLVRAGSRQQEFAVRTALGADWTRIARQLLIESVLLGILGGAFGLICAYGGIRMLVAIAPANIPRLSEISLDPTVLLFTLGVSTLAGLLFGLIPVFKYARPQLNSALREGGRAMSAGRERHRARNILVVTQVALALVLLVSSGLMIRTFQSLRDVQPGFVRPLEVLTLRISIPEAAVRDSEQVTRTHEQIVRRLEQIPGVTSVALSSSVPMDGDTSMDPIFVEDHPAPEGQLPLRRYQWISARYFETMGDPILAGRDLTWADIFNKTPVVMVSETFAREYWKTPGEALGRRIRETPKSPWREIIGVVGKQYDDGAHQKAPIMVYWPILIADFWGDKLTAMRSLVFSIRSPRTGSSALLKEVQEAVWAVNPNLPLANVRSLDEIYRKSMVRTTFTLLILGISACVALLLGVVGIYGVISYSVTQRTREIGIRMALGARHEEVSRLFLRHGLLLTGAGVAVGIGAAIGVTRLLSALLFGVTQMDPLTYCAVSMVLLAAALLACYLPARRAAIIDPVRALRSE